MLRARACKNIRDRPAGMSTDPKYTFKAASTAVSKMSAANLTAVTFMAEEV